MRNHLVWLAILFAFSFFLVAMPATAQQAEPISVNQTGTAMGNGPAGPAGYPPDLSANGRFIAFTSSATDLVSGTDINNSPDVFVRDRILGTTELISTTASGVGTGDRQAFTAMIDETGRFVVFNSEAMNHVALDDANGGIPDVFVHDRQLGTTSVVSINATGDATGSSASLLRAYSEDGTTVAFFSQATDLSPTDTNGVWDLYLRDLVTNTTTLASGNAAGTDSAAHMYAAIMINANVSISNNGRRVVYATDAANIVAGDANGVLDVFLFDLDTGTSTLVSRATDAPGTANGTSTQPVISGDGRYVTFRSDASNIVEIDTNQARDFFVFDVAAGTNALVSIPTGGTDSVADGVFVTPAAISVDGRFIAFTSTADTLVANDTNGERDLFLRDRIAETTTLVSLTPTGFAGSGLTAVHANQGSPFSADGRFLVFTSQATDLVDGVDSNGSTDVFVRDLRNNVTRLVSRATAGGAGDARSRRIEISADGDTVAFWSEASDLVTIDANGVDDVYAMSHLVLFSDGFESSDLSAWSQAVP